MTSGLKVHDILTPSAEVCLQFAAAQQERNRYQFRAQAAMPHSSPRTHSKPWLLSTPSRQSRLFYNYRHDKAQDWYLIFHQPERSHREDQSPCRLMSQ